MTTALTPQFQTNPGATAGPPDPNAPLAAKAYTIFTSLLGLVTLASTFHLITTDQATAVSNVGTSVVGLVGTVVAAVAAFRTTKQVKNGTFDPAPPTQIVVAPNPVDNAFDAVTQLKGHLDAAVEDAVSKVKTGVDIMQGAISLLPGGVKPADAVSDLLHSL